MHLRIFRPYLISCGGSLPVVYSVTYFANLPRWNLVWIYHNLHGVRIIQFIRRVDFFPLPIFTKSPRGSTAIVQIAYTEFHPNRKILAESKNRYYCAPEWNAAFTAFRFTKLKFTQFMFVNISHEGFYFKNLLGKYTNYGKNFIYFHK